MKTKITQEVQVRPFITPNFIITEQPPGSRSSGFIEAPKIPLSDADAQTLSALCDQFREEVFAKAGKKDPRLT